MYTIIICIENTNIENGSLLSEVKRYGINLTRSISTNIQEHNNNKTHIITYFNIFFFIHFFYSNNIRKNRIYKANIFFTIQPVLPLSIVCYINFIHYYIHIFYPKQKKKLITLAELCRRDVSTIVHTCISCTKCQKL